ncbi:MAG: hypothetical protein LAQ69_25755 [Acidobacteriia bacterium]|nr:hypothetical protein [Terriglobia bacterium]
MTNARFFAWLTLAAGMAAASASTLSAQDWHDIHRDRQDLRLDYRDIDHDYDRVNRLRADIAGDRARLDEDIRCGRSRAAARDAQDLARDQRALAGESRDIRHDQVDAFRDRQDIHRDNRDWR